ncbi:sensor histidine kinase N-terminal domain-containing protein [Paenalcaligenes niemegkensis]|uniref:sensor histidine kinase n=1 Tax=Paenalcaligenes niemegkensis TaxID=2895469 RepID=UPI001EE7F70D|nr:sensor histidine kinase [Paenalcaligenes niemegkensis]MCQ9616507.1 sensor histidine kinase N-terminal domain-containing protein [Paenalcaligenes niemegkensis]
MSNGFSIQRRIVIVGLLILSVAVLAMGVISYQYAQRASDRAFDRLLTASALTVANAIRNEDGALLVELPYSAMAMLPKNEKVFYVVRSAEQLIAGYPDLDADLPLANSEQPAYQNIHYKNLHLRISSIGRFSSGSSQGEPQWLTIRVAETRNTRETLAKELFTQSLLPMGVLIALAIVILALGIRIAFSPLRTLKSELQTRSPTNLNPITRPVPSEISGLVQTLNAFMLRLGNAMQTMQTLVADAAHQIRTPMSSLRLQSELALLETDKKRQHELLEAIHRNCAQTSKLINQMLMDATITHRRNTTVFSSLAPQTLIKDSVSRLSPEERSRISVNLTPPAQQAELAGDPIALREMLRNLLENALLYAPDSDVEIRTYLSLEKKLVFDVSDRGPGLSASEAESVMERFVRGSTAGKTLGSGLGLAIAQNVAKAHGEACNYASAMDLD